MSLSVLVAGATGLVGTAVVEIAAKDSRFGRVITWGRRPLPAAPANVEHWGPVEGDLPNGLRPERVDAVICCLGTTMRNVKGDKQAFLHVDRDLVLALGQWASGRGTRFCLVSAMGADAGSLFFYNRAKGEVEAALRRMDFAALHLFRPSILDGPRKEARTGERLGLVAMRTLRPLLPPDYRPMPHDRLAKALVNAAAGTGTGTQVHTYRSILALAG
jgi:uncharacterized protein YbjT (DUF2867 family)